MIPNSYEAIVDIYLHFNNFKIRDQYWIEQKYPFMNVRGVTSSNEIKSWIEKYLAILLIRVEMLPENEKPIKFKQQPPVPQTITDLGCYKDQLERFKTVVKKVYEDKIVNNFYSQPVDMSVIVGVLDDFISSSSSSSSSSQ